MARMADLDEGLRALLEGLECASEENPAWVAGPALSNQRVAIISTAGLLTRGDRPFTLGEASYRIIPGDTASADILMSHVSTNFDRSGFQQDINVAFPIDRLRELETDGVIGSVAEFHYSFMGATDPAQMRPTVEHLAPLLKQDKVNTLLLAPV